MSDDHSPIILLPFSRQDNDNIDARYTQIQKLFDLIAKKTYVQQYIVTSRMPNGYTLNFNQLHCGAQHDELTWIASSVCVRMNRARNELTMSIQQCVMFLLFNNHFYLYIFQIYEKYIKYILFIYLKIYEKYMHCVLKLFFNFKTQCIYYFSYFMNTV